MEGKFGMKRRLKPANPRNYLTLPWTRGGWAGLSGHGLWYRRPSRSKKIHPIHIHVYGQLEKGTQSYIPAQYKLVSHFSTEPMYILLPI